MEKKRKQKEKNNSSFGVIKAKLDPTLIKKHLGRELYQTVEFAAWELIQNSLDACIRAGMKPGAFVQFLEPSHTTYSVGSSVIIGDHGPGIVDIERFQRIATDDKYRKCIGRFAAYALTSGDDPSFHVFTATEGMTEVAHYHFVDKDFVEEGIAPSFLDRSEVPMAPTSGSFTIILIPNISDEEFTPKGIEEFISWYGPLYINVIDPETNEPYQWNIQVNGNRVLPYSFESSVDIMTDEIADLQGKIKIEIGLKKNDSDPGIFLCDSMTGRKIMLAPTEFFKKVDPIFRYPQLTGNIFMPRLEQYSQTNRSGLVDTFWKRMPGNRFTEACSIYGADPLKEMLDQSDDETSSSTVQHFGQLARATERMNESHVGDLPQKASSRSRRRRTKNTANKATGIPKDQHRQTILYIDGNQYRIASNLQEGTLPVELAGDGETIKIFTRNPSMRQILKTRDSIFKQQALIQLITMAVFTHHYPNDSMAAFTNACDWTNRIIEEMQMNSASTS